MKSLRLLKLSLALLFISAISTAQQTRNCGTMQHLDEMLQKDPKMAIRMENIERHVASHLRTTSQNESQAVKTIPVVVHIVYNVSSQNLTDGQVQSQIDVLNEDFRRTNTDAANTPSFFSSIASVCAASAWEIASLAGWFAKSSGAPSPLPSCARRNQAGSVAESPAKSVSRARRE